MPQDFSVSAHVTFPEGDLKVEDVTLQISVDEKDSTLSGGALSVDDLTLENFRGGEIILSGFDGIISSSGSDVVKLRGTSTSAILDTVVINKNGVPVKIETDGLLFDNLHVSDIALDSLSFVTTGNIDVATRGNFDVQNEEVNFREFTGFFDLTGRGLKMTGHVRSLSIDGNPGVSIK